MRTFIMALLLCSFISSAETVTFGLRANDQFNYTSHSPLFSDNNANILFFAADIEVEYNGIRLASSLYKEGHSDKPGKAKLALAELMYDFSVADWQFSLGKKKLDWGIGYGFRPLDLFSPVDPLAIDTAIAEGTLLFSADWFSSYGAWTTLCNQSQVFYKIAGHQQEKSLGCGARYYGYFDTFELQGLLHYDQDMKVRIGGSALSVLNDSVEVHASVLWQHSYLGAQFTPPDLTTSTFINPVESRWQHSALQSLLGVNFSTAYGVTFIAEYWFDGRSPSKKQWQNMIKGLDTLIATSMNNPLSGHYITAQQQLFSSQNLFKNNLMLHTRYSYNNWQPELTLLFNPDDAGLSANAKLNYTWANGQVAEFGLKRYLGPADSIYKKLNFDTTVYVGFTLAF